MDTYRAYSNCDFRVTLSMAPSIFTSHCWFRKVVSSVGKIIQFLRDNSGITYLLTYFMVRSPSWEANWSTASQETPRISRNPKVHYRTHKRPPTVSILGQPNPVPIHTSHFLEIHPNIIRPSTDNIRMDLQEVECGYMDWIGLAQDRDRWLTLVSAVMNLRVPWNAGSFLTSCKLRN